MAMLSSMGAASGTSERSPATRTGEAIKPAFFLPPCGFEIVPSFRPLVVEVGKAGCLGPMSWCSQWQDDLAASRTRATSLMSILHSSAESLTSSLYASVRASEKARACRLNGWGPRALERDVAIEVLVSSDRRKSSHIYAEQSFEQSTRPRSRM